MLIKSGQLELETSSYGFYARVPWVGAVFYSSAMGLSFDTWSQISAEASHTLPRWQAGVDD